MSRRVVVSDSSVLIDLERGAFFAAAFALPLEFCVPDLLYRREIEPFGGGRLVHMSLRVLELDDAGVARDAETAVRWLGQDPRPPPLPVPQGRGQQAPAGLRARRENRLTTTLGLRVRHA